MGVEDTNMIDGNVSKTRGNMGLLLLIAAGVTAGMVMALLTVGGQEILSAVGLAGPNNDSSAELPTPIPDSIRVGAPAPDFSTVTPGGESFALSDFRGSAVAVNFWATWCAPCRVEMPALQSASQTYGDGELVILAINAGESPDKIEEFMQEFDLTFKAGLDRDGQIIDQYAVRVFPTTIWVDPDGVVRAEHFGPLSEDQIDGYVSTLLTP